MPKSKNRKSFPGSKRSGVRRNNIVRVSRPPQIKSIPILSHKFRYAGFSNAGLSLSVSPNDVLGAMGTMATAANTVRSIFSSFRIIQVEIWGNFGNNSLINAESTISINWNAPSTVFPANVEVSDSSLSTAYTPYLRAKPPRGSQAAFWQDSSASTMFNVTASYGCIVDVTVLACMSDQQSTVVFTTASTATVGTEYWLALDGNSTNILLPQSLLTIA